MKITYIYHVIGTLTMRHIRLSLESLYEQEEFHWDRFVLYNGSEFQTDRIMDYVPYQFFDKVEVFPYDSNTPKTASSDWNIQMQQISGADRYLCHKADFYLHNRTCQNFEDLPDDHDWFLLFNKFDMKEGCIDDDIRFYATRDWKSALGLSTTGPYSAHVGKMAIPYHQSAGIDGVMHGYTDGARKFYKPEDGELHMKWGINKAIGRMSESVPFIKDDEFFAMHIHHETPDRLDGVKLMPGEKF